MLPNFFASEFSRWVFDYAFISQVFLPVYAYLMGNIKLQHIESDVHCCIIQNIVLGNICMLD